MTGLVGREQPAAVLDAQVDRTVTSHGGLVMVTGEAGIGKSALVAATVDRARAAGALTAVGTCWDRDGAPDHWPWVQVVRSLAATAEPEAWAEARAAAGGDVDALVGTDPVRRGDATVGGGGDRFGLLDATTTLLTTLARHRPVVAVLEDLHWADVATLDLLAFASRHGWYERVLLVGTYRDVEVEAPDHPLRPALSEITTRATTVVLTGLDVDGVSQVVEATTGEVPSAEVATTLHRRTGGNPFFVEQAARLWHSTGDVDTLPPGVRDTVAHRLAALPEGLPSALATVALLGRTVPRAVVSAALPADPTTGDPVDALRAAAGARLITIDGERIGFVHDLVRETLIDGLATDDAAARHAALLDRLAAPELRDLVPAADLAHHALQAGELVPVDRRISLAQTAARDALARTAADEAAAHLRRALEALPADRRRDEAFLRVELGWALIRTGALPATRDLFEQACRIALELDDDALLTRAALSLRAAVWMSATDDDQRRAAAMVDEAHRRVVVDRGLPPGTDDAIGRERALTAAALDLCRSSGDERAIWDALTVRHDAVWAPGTERERLALDDEMVDLAARSGSATADIEARQRRVLDLVGAGDPRAVDEHHDLVARAEQLDTAMARCAGAWSGATIAALTGRFDDARAHLDELATLDRVSGAIGLDLLLSQVRWSVELAQAREDAVDATLARAATVHPAADLLRAVTAAERGEGARAASLLEAIEGRGGPGRWFAPLWLRAMARTAAITGDPDALAACRRELEPLSGFWAVMAQAEVHGPYDLWAGLVAAAEGRTEDAEHLLASAATAADSMGARPWAVEARSHLAAMRARDAAVAAETAALVDSVVEEARALGMARVVGRMESLGITTGATTDAPVAPTPSGSPAPTGGDPKVPSVPSVPSVSSGSDGTDGAVFRRSGDVWEVGVGGTTAHVPDAKGLRDIHVLLGRPGMGVRAVDLLDPAAGGEGRAARSMGADAVLDERAKAAYRTRLEHLDEAIETAIARGDDRQAAELDTERAALIDELRRATGLGGRARRLGDDAERARKAVRERIRDSIRRLDAVHPALAAHLRDSVRTGATCSYEPTETMEWRR